MAAATASEAKNKVTTLGDLRKLLAQFELAGDDTPLHGAVRAAGIPTTPEQPHDMNRVAHALCLELRAVDVYPDKFPEAAAFCGRHANQLRLPSVGDLRGALVEHLRLHVDVKACPPGCDEAKLLAEFTGEPGMGFELLYNSDFNYLKLFPASRPPPNKHVWALYNCLLEQCLDPMKFPHYAIFCAGHSASLERGTGPDIWRDVAGYLTGVPYGLLPDHALEKLLGPYVDNTINAFSAPYDPDMNYEKYFP